MECGLLKANLPSLSVSNCGTTKRERNERIYKHVADNSIKTHDDVMNNRKNQQCFFVPFYREDHTFMMRCISVSHFKLGWFYFPIYRPTPFVIFYYYLSIVQALALLNTLFLVLIIISFAWCGFWFMERTTISHWMIIPCKL